MQKIRLNKNITCTYGSLIVGIVVGCILFVCSFVNMDNGWFDFNIDNYDITIVMNLPQDKIIGLILKKRILQIIMFILLLLVGSYQLVALCFCGGFGCYYGIVICNLIIKYGFGGLLYGLACFFPHYLCYFFVIYFYGKKVYARKENENRYYKNINILQQILSAVGIILIIFFALLWEIKFQKNFLNYFFQYLV